MHVRTDFHFTQRILHLQLYAFLILVEKQLMHFADMSTHIQTVVSGMKFNRRVQDFSVQMLSNPSVLRRLSHWFLNMDGIHNSQSSTLSKKVMSPC